jgi:hypothetical protein
MTLADDPFAELTAQLNLAAASSAPNATGSACDGTSLNQSLNLGVSSLGFSSSANGTGRAGVGASLNPFDMFDAPRQAPTVAFTAGAPGGGMGAGATGYFDPFLAATAIAVVAPRPPGPPPPLTAAPPPPPPLPAGWEAAWSEDDKDYYFYREDTGEVTWEVPK